MQKVYSRVTWENEPSKKTPLSEDNLNKMDYAIDQIDSRVVEQQSDIDNAAGTARQAQNAASAEASRAAASEEQLNTAIRKEADRARKAESDLSLSLQGLDMLGFSIKDGKLQQTVTT